VTSGRPGLHGPFAPAPLQGLHHYYGPSRPCASRYSAPRGFRRLGSSLSRPAGRHHPSGLADGIETTGSPVPCQRPRRAHATFTPGTTRATRRPLPGWGHTQRACLCPRDESRSRVSMPIWCLSMRQQWFTHVRLLVAHLTRSCRAFPGTLTTTALYRRSFRWFGLSACTASPEGRPPSLAQHGSCWWPSTSPPLSFQDTRTPDMEPGVQVIVAGW